MTSENNPRGSTGNFANDPAKASEAGKKAGQHSHQGSSRSADPSEQEESGTSSGKQRGGSGNFANDPERASEAGKKGGEHSHLGK